MAGKLCFPALEHRKEIDEESDGSILRAVLR